MEHQDHATAGAGETIPNPIASTAMQESQTPAVPAEDPPVQPEIASSSANEAVAQPEANKATTVALPKTPTDTEPVVNPSSADPVPQSISQPETVATPAAHHHPADLEVAGDSDVGSQNYGQTIPLPDFPKGLIRWRFGVRFLVSVSPYGHGM